MSWTKLSDDFFRHRKTSRLSNEAMLVYLFLLTECAAQGTDGEVFVPTVRMALARFGAEHSICDELLRADMLNYSDDGSLWITNYLEYNPSRSEVEQQRQAKNERQDRWRKSRSSSRDADVDGLQDATQYGTVDATHDAPQDATLPRVRVEPVPVPISQTRPQDINPLPPARPEKTMMTKEAGLHRLPAEAHYPVGWEDAEALSPGVLLARYRKAEGKAGEERLKAWLAAARKTVHSQPAYLRPCILGWLRGDEPDPVEAPLPTLALPPTRSINAAAAAQAEALRAEHGSVAAAITPPRKENP